MAEASAPTASPGPRAFLEFRPLLGAPAIASDAKKIILATAGVLAVHAGWFGLDRLFPGSRFPYEAEPTLPGSGMAEALPEVSTTGAVDAFTDLTEPFWTLVGPLAGVFAKGIGQAGWFQAALMTTWAIIVWGIFGGAIARIAVVQAAGDRRIGLRSAFRFALGKWGSLIGAPLTPMLAVGLLAGGCALFGLLYRIPSGIGGFIATAIGFVPLLLGLVMALIVVGLAIGWPLMHATIAAEGEDAPDALSRSYSYVNQRLGRYASHAAVALAIGSVGLMAVIAFARLVLVLAEWGVSLGAPDLANLDEWVKNGRVFWSHTVGLLVLAWVYSYYWSASSIIYLILRRDVDGTPWHDVYLPEHADDSFAGTNDPITRESADAESAGSPMPPR